MPDLEPGTGSALRLLGSGRDVDNHELLQLYSYPAEQRGTWLRANVISSLDGGATAGGVSGQLGGPGDRLVFHLLRELADVILVGAGTVRIEGYGGAQLSAAARQRRMSRVADRQAEVPQLAIVTNSGRLDPDAPVFTKTEVAPLILTCTAAAERAQSRLAGLADVVDCSGANPDAVDMAAILTALHSRGLVRVLLEGGPTLLGSFIEQNLLDELCLTVSPCVVGGPAGRVATSPGQLLTWLRCAHVLADDSGYLYTRYVRA